MPVALHRVAAGLLVLLIGAWPAAAQVGPSPPPGPFVVDLRGAMIGLPSGDGFYPSTADTTSIPTRGFGGEMGAHAYFLRLGAAQVGAGVSVLRARGTATTTVSTDDTGTLTTDAAATLTTIAPQVSFNFGTRDGWSYLSGGFGAGEVRTSVSDTETGEAARDTGWVGVFNIGGGARWFFSARLAFGFDVRLYRFSDGAASESGGAAPGFMATAVTAGVSFR